jgi:Xaa-Pro aminopeptidase
VTLKDRQVLTVEPGLYYPGLGGVRLEDVVVVTKSRCKILSRFPKRLEI